MSTSTPRKILITDDVHPLLIEGLSHLGEVDFDPTIPYEKVKEIVSDYWGIVINSKIIVDQEFLNRAVQLAWVGRLGSGLDIIDLPAAAARGVDIINSPGGNANAVGEHALGMLLALLNKLIPSDRMVRRMAPWNRESMRGVELDGKTVGIIGCGHAGSAFVRKLRGFDVRVLIYDKYRTSIPPIHPNQEEVPLETLLRQSDIVSFHVPLTSETRHYADASFLSAMKKNSILINTSRGKVVDLPQAVEALHSEKLAGLCLDVFPNEKPVSYTTDEKKCMSQLADKQNVVLSPHVAGWTVESKRKLAEILLEKIIYATTKDEL